MSEPLDQWVDKNAADLKKDIACHLENEFGDLVRNPGENNPHEDVIRNIMISVRQWAQTSKQG